MIDMRGKLIIIEGGDGSGKATQTAMLVERLAAEGRPVRSVSFPDYDSDSSALVKMYLRGDFGGDADGSTPLRGVGLYAVDRFASYQTQWKSFLQDGGIVVADRYTTSNMLYQMIKIDDAAAHGRPTWTGCGISSSASWACRARIWSSSWTCPWR